MDYVENLRQRISYQGIVLHWVNKTGFLAGPVSRERDGVAMVQQFAKSITALALFVLSGAAAGQAPTAPLTLKPDAPDRYIVVPGDTLWGISERYTDSPWRWPELWGLNKEQIRNPHLIYPGYVIVLDRARGTLSIGGPDSTTTAPAAPGTAPGAVKLGPRIRVESLARQEIPSIPSALIEPF